MPRELRHTLAKRGPKTNRRLHSPIGPVTVEPDGDAVTLRTALRSPRGMTEVSIAIGADDFAAVLRTMMAVDRQATLDAVLRCREQ